MRKILTLMAVAALLLLFNLAETATAQDKSGKRDVVAGICPTGTCAKNGGKHAKNLKFCAASNCAKGGSPK